MVEGIPLNTPTVSMAHMIKTKKDNPIFIPSKFVEKLKIEGKEEEWAVMICTSPCTTKTIRIISTKSPKVLQLHFSKIKFSAGEFLENIGSIFKRNNLKSIYSTGLCFCDPPCGWECYIDFSELLLTKEQLKSELLAVPSIGNVEITNVDLKRTG